MLLTRRCWSWCSRPDAPDPRRTFIKWKPTIVNWLFAAAFLVSQYTRARPSCSACWRERHLDDGSWKRLNFMWIGFFCSPGAQHIRRVRYDETTWVNFKLFGLMA